MSRLVPNRLADWQRLREEVRAGINLSSPDRLAAVEEFRRELDAACGEEPTVAMTLGRAVLSSEDLVDVPLADYLAWFLKARHGAIYRWDGEEFRPLAAFGITPRTTIGQGTILPRWLLEHGVLARTELNLVGLSADEAEALLRELDALDATLVIPITLNEALWGFFTIGSPLAGAYDGSEGLYLNLYGLAVLSSLEHRRQGLPTRQEQEIRQEDEALKGVMELWVALKPSPARLRLLIVDEEAEAIRTLSRFFSEWGFEVSGASTEETAIEELIRMNPHLLLADLSLHWKFPKRLVETARSVIPASVLLGTTTVRNEAWDELVMSAGVQQIFRKPFRFARLAKTVFEAALSVSLDLVPSTRTRQERCLIVEDEKEAAEPIKEFLQNCGHPVWTAGTAKEALSLAARVRPQIVLLDLRLPDSEGAGLLQQIRKVSPNSRVIVLTAWIQEYPGEMFKTFQPDAYCTKPFPVSELHRVVEQVLVR
jgi:DNA-binding response OmpR family regulator